MVQPIQFTKNYKKTWKNAVLVQRHLFPLMAVIPQLVVFLMVITEAEAEATARAKKEQVQLAVASTTSRATNTTETTVKKT